MPFFKPNIPEPPALPPMPNENAAEEAVAEERRKQRPKLGRRSTILTGPQGDLSPVSIRRRTLLGE